MGQVYEITWNNKSSLGDLITTVTINGSNKWYVASFPSGIPEYGFIWKSLSGVNLNIQVHEEGWGENPGYFTFA